MEFQADAEVQGTVLEGKLNEKDIIHSNLITQNFGYLVYETFFCCHKGYIQCCLTMSSAYS